MPVSKATTERQFNIMRRVKTTSSMSAECMSGLAMLHSYKHMAIDIENVIIWFAGKMDRKLDFC